MASSSLSSVVSDLVRAQMGNSLPGTVTDEDLDRCIGEIILREAKAKAERYQKEGIRAYIPKSDPNVPKANKRFLSSIIRSTDDHNKAILRAQAVAAAEYREEREEQERQERRARADEATRVRKRKLRRRGESEDRWQPETDRGREHERRRRKRDWAKEDWSVSRSRSSSRSRSPKHERYYERDTGSSRKSKSEHRRHRRHRRRRRHHDDSRSLSQSPSRSRRDKGKGKGRETSQSHERDHDDVSRRHRSPSRLCSPHRSKKSGHTRSLSPASSVLISGDESKTQTLPRPPSASPRAPERVDFEKATSSSRHFESSTPGPPPPEPSPPIASKMDKYFDPSYDPRLDVAPLATKNRLTIDVPATGLIDNASFEGWDAMLDLIRQRREDKVERRRLERLGLLPDKAKEGRGQKGKGMVSGISEESKGIMTIEYAKRGSVREWDMGKESI